MRILTFALLAATAYSQSSQLPTPIQVSLLIVDSNGDPLFDAAAWHLGGNYDSKATHLDGKLTFQTRAPAIVIRKEGYLSAFIRTADASPGPLRVTLAKRTTTPVLSSCKTSNGSPGRNIGSSSSFRLLPTPDINTATSSTDNDYTARTYCLKQPGPDRCVQHGTGPNWTYGLPANRDVWDSVRYQETVYVADPFLIDARGESVNGLRWRYIGLPGESVSYRNVDPTSAAKLDAFLDTLCTK